MLKIRRELLINLMKLWRVEEGMEGMEGMEGILGIGAFIIEELGEGH